MQDRSDHRNRETETSGIAVASEEAGWRKDDRLSLLVFTGVLCAGVVAGIVFAESRAHADAAASAPTVTDQPLPTRLQLAQAVEPQPATAAGAEANPDTVQAQAEETAVVDEGSSESEAPAWVAGVEPDQRPAGAPVIRQMTKDSDWYSRALTGLSRPYPESFKFLEDQEAWYTPFTRPGMTGPYDLRGWHGATQAEGS